MEKRIDKVNYYLDIAEAVSERSTCLRKKYGCVIVKNDEIISTGYSGAPRGRKNCCDLGFCNKKKQFPDVHHAGYDACRSVHAEQNAIISAPRKDMLDSSMFLVGIRCDTHDYEKGASPCLMCRKLIINSGIKYIFVRINDKEYEELHVDYWITHDELLEGKIQY